MEDKEEIKCKYFKYYDDSNIYKYKRDIPLEDFKNITKILKKEISFLVRNYIPPLPKQYELWFPVFCYIVENKKELSDLEIKGLYRKLYEDVEDFSKGDIPRLTIDKISHISKEIEYTLEDIIKNIEIHQKNLDKHTERIENKKEEIKEESLLFYIKKILEELQNIKEENQIQSKKLQEYHEEIRKLREELKITKKEADQDFLTNLPNRRRFFRALEDFLKDFKEKGYIFSLILLDVDNFKKINDTYGHPVGDLVLKDISAVLRFYLRANTIAGRIGGEEFGIILPGVDIETAKKVAERLRQIFETRKVHTNGDIINYTVSLGVTQVKEGDTVDTIYQRADEALYEAKKTGKNKVVVKL